MSARGASAALAARIYGSFPVAQPAFRRLLHLLDVEATDAVPTAAVTLGGRSRLLVNPDFVARHCASDHALVMLVLHELHHVALGHTRLFRRLTPAQNWAFDCVINAQLCRLYPEPHHTALFRAAYRADAMPEAMLRPPEGWGTRDVRWLPGRAGEVHRALYSETSVTYADLYALLPTVYVGATAVGLDRLLGGHGVAGDGTDIAPDVLRELRGILAEWPMVAQVSGHDDGGEVRASHVSPAQARRDAAAVLRRAILSIADLDALGCGVPLPGTDLRDAVLPYALRPQRADAVRQAAGVPTLLYATRLAGAGPVRGERVHVYFDVSGSMDMVLPVLYPTLASLAPLLHEDVHLFSTRIDDVRPRDLARGVRVTTGGTSIAAVTAHALEHRVRRALLVTDGWAGDVPNEHAYVMNRRGARFAVALTHDGQASFASALRTRTFRLPAL